MATALPDVKCSGCRFLNRETVFDLCVTDESKYTAEGRTDWHTIGHMRGRFGACGDEAKLCRPPPKT